MTGTTISTASTLELFDLPSEILVSVLTPFLTADLLPLTTVSRRFHSVILRIIHFRLLLAASLPDYKLILEAYHPSKRYFDPYLFCTYLGTDGLSSTHEGEGSLYADCATETGRFAKMGMLYSRFRPERPLVAGSMPLRRIAGATPVQSQNGNPNQPIYSNAGDGGSIKVVYTINLDSEELFGQFCAYSSLVTLGPRRGVFLSAVPIVEPKQGTIRIWKEWLCERARELRKLEVEGATEVEPVLERSSTTAFPDVGQDQNIMWTDYRRNVGLKVAVRCREERCYDESPGLDTIPLAFDFEIQGMLSVAR